MKRAIRSRGSKCFSFQTPRSCGEMRPSGVTAAASVNAKPAPPTARAARCAKCQSFAEPSTDEYWHIGETTMRLAKSTSRMRSLLNRCGMDQWSRSRMDGRAGLVGRGWGSRYDRRANEPYPAAARGQAEHARRSYCTRRLRSAKHAKASRGEGV